MALYVPAWAIKIALSLYNRYSAAKDTAVFWYNKLNDAINTLFFPTYYVFVTNSIYPHKYTLNKGWYSDSIAPELLFNADTLVFFPWTLSPEHENLKRALPILSLELVNKKGLAEYDLTDFIEKVRYVGNTVFPTVGHVISVWQLNHHTVLDPSDMTVRYIDADGNVVETDIRCVKQIISKIAEDDGDDDLEDVADDDLQDFCDEDSEGPADEDSEGPADEDSEGPADEDSEGPADEDSEGANTVPCPTLPVHENAELHPPVPDS